MRNSIDRESFVGLFRWIKENCLFFTYDEKDNKFYIKPIGLKIELIYYVEDFKYHFFVKNDNGEDEEITLENIHTPTEVIGLALDEIDRNKEKSSLEDLPEAKREFLSFLDKS